MGYCFQWRRAVIKTQAALRGRTAIPAPLGPMVHRGRVRQKLRTDSVAGSSMVRVERRVVTATTAVMEEPATWVGSVEMPEIKTSMSMMAIPMPITMLQMVVTAAREDLGVMLAQAGPAAGVVTAVTALLVVAIWAKGGTLATEATEEQAGTVEPGEMAAMAGPGAPSWYPSRTTAMGQVLCLTAVDRAVRGISAARG